MLNNNLLKEYYKFGVNNDNKTGPTIHIRNFNNISESDKIDKLNEINEMNKINQSNRLIKNQITSNISMNSVEKNNKSNSALICECPEHHNINEKIHFYDNSTNKNNEK